MPFVSKAQQRWGNSPAGKKALGSKLPEFNTATKGKKLPNKVKKGKKSTSESDKHNTTAHLIETSGHHLGHAIRHSLQLSKAKGKAAREFNHEHMHTHLKGGAEHVQKLTEHVLANYPKVGKELQTLKETAPGPHASVKQVLQRSKKLR